MRGVCVIGYSLSGPVRVPRLVDAILDVLVSYMIATAFVRVNGPNMRDEVDHRLVRRDAKYPSFTFC
jgi:hypothetical protein